ncbi:hypothetical protein BaOVIS_016800 [Babesia ovis]|uniref:Uncharacterized protein n=1 Tax=Babesia ovis TaxID=5869 RepID=A0A9W5TBE7_BABOV|nr:hypothetical protein BaOVIS_016800 [Babesia ovis]
MRSIPPWEVQSRLARKRLKTIGATSEVSRYNLQVVLNRCTRELSIRQLELGSHTTIPGGSIVSNGYQDNRNLVSNTGCNDSVLTPSDRLASNIPQSTSSIHEVSCLGDLAHILDDVNTFMQYLGYVRSNKRDRRMLIKFVNTVAHFITDPIQALKFLCSISTAVKVRSIPCVSNNTDNIKIACREAFELLFRRLDVNVNAYHTVMCYLKLCAFYGQDVTELSPIYHCMVDKLVSGDVFISEKDLDDLLFLYQRLALCDRRILDYCSERIASSFYSFNDDEICNFARYLVKSVYARDTPTKIGAGVDYSRKIGASEITGLLDDFDVPSSAYVKCLETKLPNRIHEYSYYNLVDLGEFYHVFNIQSGLLPRFSTELWKYLYTLRYGYAIKSLVVLSKLGLQDAKTFGRLIRNIPQTLAFRWPINLVAECLVSLEWTKGDKIYVVLAHYLSKHISTSFSACNVARIFDSLRNKRILLLGLYQKVLRIQDNNPGWLGCNELLSVISYGKDIGFKVCDGFELLRRQDLAALTCQQAIKVLYVMEDTYSDIVESCISVINKNCDTVQLEFDSLMQLLVACRRLNIWLSTIPQIALDTLQHVETIEVHILIKLLEILAPCGPLYDIHLLAKLEKYVRHVVDELPLRTTGRMLWLCFSVGIPMDSTCFMELLRRFNSLYEPAYNEDHLLQVLGVALQRLETHNQDTRLFLQHLTQFKDVSWRRKANEVQKIRAFQNTVDCKTFVSVFPFTADIEISTGVLAKHLERSDDWGVICSGTFDPLPFSLDTSLQTENTLLLDLCAQPFIKVVDRECKAHQLLLFYYKIRNDIVGRTFAYILEDK